MEQRLNYFEHAPKLGQKLAELGQLARTGTLSNTIVDLCNTRASQLNGCTFCVDMHSKEAKIHGERELRLYHLPVWRESRLFTDKERAALEWTELVTVLTAKGIADEDYRRVRDHLSEKEITELTFVIGVINAWNRLNAAFHGQHGSMDKMMGLEKAGLE